MLSVAEGDLLKTTDVARLLGMSDGTLRAWRARGIGPSYTQMNGHYGVVRYRRKDVMAWLAEQVVHPTKKVEKVEGLTRR